MIIEDKNFLSDVNKNFIEKNILLNNNFPYYLNYNAASGDDVKFFSHTILPRQEYREKNYIINNPYFEDCLKILQNFCSKNKIKISEILRISINFCYNCNKKKSNIHRDHNFNHKQLIVYLNDCLDKNSNTVIINNDDSIIKITPEKYKGLFFDENLKHYVELPTSGERIIMVFTFL